MIKRKKKTIKKVRYFNKKDIKSIVSKKAIGGFHSYRDPFEDAKRSEERRQYASDQKDKMTSTYGEPDYIHSLDSGDHEYYWFDQKFKVDSYGIVRSLKIRKKYLLFGEDEVWEIGANSNHKFHHEIQMALQMHLAEKILIGEHEKEK